MFYEQEWGKCHENASAQRWNSLAHRVSAGDAKRGITESALAEVYVNHHSAFSSILQCCRSMILPWAADGARKKRLKTVQMGQ